MPIRYAAGLRRRWWLPAAAAALALATAAALTAMQPPVYRASATFVVAPSERVKETADLLRSLETLERRSVIATFARLPGTPDARDGVAAELRVNPGRLAGYQIRASVLPNTNIIRIDVDGGDADLVARAANAAGRIAAEQAAKLYPIYTMRPLARAAPPRRPIFPDRRRNYGVALLLGLFVGVVAAVAAERFGASTPA